MMQIRPRTRPLLIMLPAAIGLAACSSTSSDGNDSDTAPRIPANVSTPATTQTDAATIGQDAGPPRPGEVKIFDDWAVGCDNIKRCTLASLGPQGGDFYPINLEFVRTAGPGGAITGTLDPNGDSAKPVAIAIDGNRAAMGFAAARGGAYVLAADAASNVADAMVQGHDLAILDGSGKTIARLSLAGAAAAWRYVDAQQGRSGTIDAVVATGDKPSEAVAALQPLPGRAAVSPIGSGTLPRDAVLKAMAQRSGCAPEDVPESLKPQAWALGGNSTLVFMPCSAGAYNISSAVFVIKGGQPEPARFDAPTGMSDEAPVAQVVNGDFDNGTLSTFARGRGLGDCGVQQKFVWDGTRFRLTEQTEMPDCRGNPNFITTWRTRVTRR